MPQQETTDKMCCGKTNAKGMASWTKEPFISGQNKGKKWKAKFG